MVDSESPDFPVWCLVLYTFTTVSLLSFRQRALSESWGNFGHLNEFLCTVLWESWCLELQVLFSSGLFWLPMAVLFLMILFAPFRIHGAFCSPCGAFYQFLEERGSRMRSRGAVRHLGTKLAIQMLGMVFAILLNYAVWRALVGLTLSSTHGNFLKVDVEYPLTVSSLKGFLMEYMLMFCCYVPSMLLGGGWTKMIAFLEAAVVVLLCAYFHHWTGAFMNPLSALTFSLINNKVNLLDQVVVYWMGPLLATFTAFILVKHEEKEKDS